LTLLQTVILRNPLIRSKLSIPLPRTRSGGKVGVELKELPSVKESFNYALENLMGYKPGVGWVGAPGAGEPAAAAAAAGAKGVGKEVVEKGVAGQGQRQQSAFDKLMKERGQGKYRKK
jgi:hypothetical protein